MTIQIVGDCLAANTARMKTSAAKILGGPFPIVEHGGTFVFRVELTTHSHVVVDSVDSDFERAIINQVARLHDVILCRKTGVSSEFEFRLGIPDFFSKEEQVEIGSALSDAITKYFHFSRAETSADKPAETSGKEDRWRWLKLW